MKRSGAKKILALLPGLGAKSAAEGGTKRIVYIVHLPRDGVHHLAIQGIRRYATACGWNVEECGWAQAGAPEFASVWKSPAPPIGTIVEGSVLPADLPASAYGGRPVVFLNCTRHPRLRRFAQVYLDDAAVGRAAFRELSPGKAPACAVVGYWGGPRFWDEKRLEAFRAAASAAGVPCEAFSFVDSRHGDASGEPGRLARWLASLPRHSAVFAVNDQTAVRVVAAARAAHLDIPRDLTLLSADNDTSLCESSRPTISSFQMDFETAGFMAARMLGDLLSGGDGALPGGEAESVGPLLAVRRESTMGHGRREPRILEAVEIIKRDACGGLTAAKLASRFPGSRRLFEMRFREATGHSILAEILHVRMQSVHALLSGTDTSIDAIADFCGFGSSRALRKFFLSHEGISMKEWRNRHRR
ncbi:MAG: substrate-binding domain-containing protein [Kiritimatiellae bacterium]|nr:substrate-binding domain-containing protein [Kiritimatiellia bacterium]